MVYNACLNPAKRAGEADAGASSIRDFMQLDETTVVFRYIPCTEIFSRFS